MTRLNMIVMLVLSSLFFMGGNCGGDVSGAWVPGGKPSGHQGTSAACSQSIFPEICEQNNFCRWEEVTSVCSPDVSGIQTYISNYCAGLKDNYTKCTNAGCVHNRGFFDNSCDAPAIIDYTCEFEAGSCVSALYIMILPGDVVADVADYCHSEFGKGRCVDK